MKKKLILMIGQPGVGKSTYIQQRMNEHPEEKACVVSRDAIRFSLLESGDEYFDKEKQVFSTFIKDGKAALEKYDNVYMDATHLNPASRDKVLRHFRNMDVDLCAVYIHAPLELAILQNENRKGTRGYVPKEVIRRFFNSIIPPTIDEGFVEIKTIHKKGV